MQQRQLRLGDILDDYCPRERRVTNHAVVAMVGEDVKQTRCTTCDAEHEYKHAKVPRQRRKGEAPAALYAQVAASAPKRVTHEHDHVPDDDGSAPPAAEWSAAPDVTMAKVPQEPPDPNTDDTSAEPEGVMPVPEDHEEVDGNVEADKDEGPIHRRLIRASLPRPEGQQPPARPIPEFTIRQPGGRPNRFRPRHQRPGGGGPQGGGGHQFQGNRSNGNMAGARGPRPGGGRPGMMKRQGPPGRKRSK
jgi:hypothetical protein